MRRRREALIEDVMKSKCVNPRAGKDQALSAFRWSKLQEEKHKRNQEISDGTVGPLKPLASFLRRKREVEKWKNDQS